MKKTFSTLILLFGTLASMDAASILSLKDTITDNAIVFPESFETDTHKMMENWYLRNYTELDKKAESTPDAAVSDEVYIQRLSSLPTSIEMPYNQIVRSYIDMYTQKRRGLVENMLGMSLYYMPIFEQALEKEGLPLELKYLPVIESALNPDAVSRAGATGLWQFMLPTARGLGLEVSTLVDERRDPYRSSECAAKYLKQLYGIFNDWSLAIAAYNCGAGNVNKALVRAGQGGDKKDFWAIYHYLPSETCGYVPAFIAANYVMTYFKEHGISPALAKKPILTDSIHVTKRVHFKQIADVLDMPVEELRILNPQYRQDVIPGDIHPYSLVLPSKQVYCYIMSEDSIVNHNAELYAQRTVVEPSAAGSGGNGESATNLVVKYHKVRQGETLKSIANKYGVTIASIKKANNLTSNKIKRGRTLKINTYQKVSVKNESASTAAAQSQASAAGSDTTAVEAAATAGASTSNSAASTKQKSGGSKSKAGSSTAKSSSKNGTVHVVRKGESLSRIAKRYPGVSANDIMKANNLDSSKIIPGQKLKIPSK